MKKQNNSIIGVGVIHSFGWDFIHETIDGVESAPPILIANRFDLQLEGLEERIVALEGQELKVEGFGTGILESLNVLGVEIKQNMVKLINLVVDVISSRQIYTKTIETEELCVGDSTGAKTCITKTKLDALLQKNGINNSNSSSVLNNIEAPTSNNDIEKQKEVISSPENTENNSEILNFNLETILNNENSNIETATEETISEPEPSAEEPTPEPVP